MSRRNKSSGGWLWLLLGLVVAVVALSRPELGAAAAELTGGPVGGAAPVTPAESAAWPVAGGGRVTSGFGPRSGGVHGGTDIAAPLGTPIRAVTDGQVIEAGPASGFGLWVRIRHSDDSAGQGATVSVYGHMNTITTRAGAHVRAGEQIATVGSRGQSTGPHLHLEIWPGGDRARRVDPARWLADHHVTPPIT